MDGVIAGRLGPPIGELCAATIRVAVGNRDIEVRKAGYETARDTVYFACCEGYLGFEVTNDREISIPSGWKKRLGTSVPSTE